MNSAPSVLFVKLHFPAVDQSRRAGTGYMAFHPACAECPTPILRKLPPGLASSYPSTPNSSTGPVMALQGPATMSSPR